jgi:uncharacterized protein (TIGR03000 family)
MFRRIFVLSSLTIVAALLQPEHAGAQQGQNLYQWSGHWEQGRGGASTGRYYPSEALVPNNYAPAYITDERGTREPFPATRSESSYFPTATAGYYGPGTDRTVRINVNGPANAEIWFDDARTIQKGAYRQFISPPLAPGQDYSYDIKAKWRENGEDVTRTRRIVVHAGDVVNLTFNSGAVGRMAR